MQAIAASAKNADNLRRILTTVLLLVHISPLEQFAGLFIESGMFNHILVALEDDKASGTILAAYLAILSRVALRDPNIFLQLVAEQARRNGLDERKQLEQVLDAVWRNFDYVGGARERKAVAMGSGALLTTGHPEALERLDGEISTSAQGFEANVAVNMFLDVLGELQPVDGPTGGPE